MVILRHGGELTVINSVRLDAEGESALDALGKVTHVMKIGFHGMDDAYYVDRYEAKMWTVGDGSLSEDSQLPFPDARVFMFKRPGGIASSNVALTLLTGVCQRV